MIQNKCPNLQNKAFYFILFMLQFHIIHDTRESEDISDSEEKQIVVRAVFIHCVPNEDQDAFPDNEATRFQREELYKHSALQSCRKKLALTLKILGEAEGNTGHEYIPIEHVFDGSNKKKVRLLNPYILRLRREAPLQAYKLQRVDTVVGIITESNEKNTNNFKRNRVQRGLEVDDKRVNDNVNFNNLSGPIEDEKRDQCAFGNSSNFKEDGLGMSIGNLTYTYPSTMTKDQQAKHTVRNGFSLDNTGVKRSECGANSPAWRREKRQEHNIIVEDTVGDDNIPWIETDRYYRKFHSAEKKLIDDETGGVQSSKSKFITNRPYILEPVIRREKNTELRHLGDQHPTRSMHASLPAVQENHLTNRSHNKSSKLTLKHSPHSTEKSYALYEIGKPELWYTVHVQLFEKMVSAEGKALWNDITMGDVASVSSIEPEWANQNMDVKYKPTEWISSQHFTLPASRSLCLLVPTRDDILYKDTNEDYGNLGKYLVVPKDDIVSVGDEPNMPNKRSGNYSDFNPEDREEQNPRRVLVRVSRTPISGNTEMKLSKRGPDHFLLLPHRNPHHAQIDLEARADDNELVRVGSSGSLTTMVADNSRRTRTLITVQAMNKGLASARFRVKARECGSELEDFIDKTGERLTDGPVLVPPRHIHSFRLELPTEIPMDTTHCSVALINDEGESIAVREVAIKKGDRCFCVWHCECVCLNVDPKLQCREMTEPRQVAAGLSPRERGRRARSACYPDVVTVNLVVVIFGALFTLIMLGLAKAVMGLFCRCVAVWGLNYVIQTPRKLDHYYEFNLKNVPIVYDDDGWPVHPETKQRSVRLISKEMEFALNIIIFIVVPSLMLWGLINRLRCRAKRNKPNEKRTGDTKKCFSTHDMQGQQQQWCSRRGGLRRWMTPQAEELSTDIWHKGLPADQPVECDFMRPLLERRHLRTDDMVSSCVDSEQDDAEYVLTQMQKSKESLAVSQRKFYETEPSTPGNRLSSEAVNENNK